MIARQTFHQQIAQNKRRSWLLLLVVTAVLVLLGYVIGVALTGSAGSGLIFIPAAIALSVVLSAGAWFAGDGLVLAASRAREVTEADTPQLINVVRELTLAASIPMPRVYLIDDSAPNAFATGRDPAHASVAVTTGLLEKLDREELQGVIGHELSHVRNYDIRFSLLVGVMVGSIALLSDMFLRMTWWSGMTGRRGRRSDSDSNGLQAVMMVVAIILAILAPIFGRMVQLAISRQREYLADASSVELTRNPAGLERALVRIAADPDPLEVANRATQHLYVVNPVKKLDDSSRGLFSTHPPIVDRVNRLRALTGQPPLDAGSMHAIEDLS
ncbi:MAG: zinc metalloprotease HtpX [Chloroflexota bacterium]